MKPQHRHTEYFIREFNKLKLCLRELRGQHKILFVVYFMSLSVRKLWELDDWEIWSDGKETTLAWRDCGTMWKTSHNIVAQVRFEPTTSQVQTYSVTVTSPRSARQSISQRDSMICKSSISRSPVAWRVAHIWAERHVRKLDVFALGWVDTSQRHFRLRYELTLFLKTGRSWCFNADGDK
jgi:hypothetical protein